MNLSTIFLYGPSGSGKSTVGRLLAQSLDLPFYDLDAEIEARSGMAIPAIFATEGEAGFRGRERAELEHLLAGGQGVIALGGGALVQPSNRSMAEAHGTVLLLHAPAEILLERLRKDTIQRPLLAGDAEAALAGLLSRRAEHYASFPVRLDTAGLTPADAAWEAQIRLGMFRVKAMSGSGSKPGGYDVRVQAGGLDALGEMAQAGSLKGPVVVISDTNVGPIYAGRAFEALQKAGYVVQSALVPAGEHHKSVETVSQLWKAFLAAGVERSSTVVAVGGGVVSDLAGFAAATWLRGVGWVAVPTTLLAMADASLGGKTGADLPEGKNLVGAFYPPSLVLADPDTLVTLPPAELRSGLAEVVKHGVIGDPALFEECAALEGLDDPIHLKEVLPEIVRRAMAVKVRVIEADPYEQNVRASLNLGHTVGHAIELASGFQLRHGEAVAIGMVAEARMAERMGVAQPGLAEQIATVLIRLGLPTHIPPGLDRPTVLAAMALDKKKSAGKVRFALPVRIGEVKTGVEVEEIWRNDALIPAIERS